MKAKKSQGTAMQKSKQVSVTIGIDLGDRFSHYCILNGDGDAIETGGSRLLAKLSPPTFKMYPARELHWRLAPIQPGSANY